MSILRHLHNREGQPGRLHDVTLETHEGPQLLFDPKRDITEDDWQKFERELQGYRERSNWAAFVQLAACMKLIDPSRKSSVTREDLGVIEKYFEGQRRLRKATVGKHPGGNQFFGHHLSSVECACLKILNPRYVIPAKMVRKHTINLHEQFHGDNGGDDTGETVTGPQYMIYDMILAPEVASDIYRHAWEERLTKRMWVREEIKKRGILDFAFAAAGMKLSRMPSSLMQESDFADLREQLNRERQEGTWMSFSDMALALAILSANAVEVTDHGLKLDMPSIDFIRSTQHRPERKVT